MLEKSHGKTVWRGLKTHEKKKMPRLPLPFVSSQLRPRHHKAEMSFVSCVLSKFLTYRTRGDDNEMAVVLAKIQGSLVGSFYTLAKWFHLCLLANFLILKSSTIHFKGIAVIFYPKFLEVLKFSFIMRGISDYLVFHVIRNRNQSFNLQMRKLRLREVDLLKMVIKQVSTNLVFKKDLLVNWLKK